MSNKSIKSHQINFIQLVFQVMKYLE